MSPDMFVLQQVLAWVLRHPKTTALLVLAVVLIEGALVLSGIWEPQEMGVHTR